MDYYKKLTKTFIQKYWLARKPNAAVLNQWGLLATEHGLRCSSVTELWAILVTPCPRPFWAQRHGQLGNTALESIPKNKLHDQTVGAVSQSKADAKIEFPIRREIEIDCREDLMLLL